MKGLTISEIDKNFEVKSENYKDTRYFDTLDEPFSLYGVFYENGAYRRLPESVAKEVSVGVHALHTHTAGGRIRFVTDSPYISVLAKYSSVGKMPHFALTGSAGFDLYENTESGEVYVKTFIPQFGITDTLDSTIPLQSSALRSFTINFPLYSSLSKVYIGVKEGSRIEKADSYAIEKPIVYYGSSITQGGCASRPGLSYQSIISRALDANYVNLGFSGNAKAEEAISDYISGLDMSLLVYDYDHNAPSVEHLEKTHLPMIMKIRKSNPDLPIIILPRPKFTLDKNEEQRFEIIKATYDYMLSLGDKNVYMLDGKALMALAENEGTVDNCHPNDLGFFSVASALIPLINDIVFS